MGKIYSAQTCQIWTLSADRNEYERYKNLLSKSSTVETLQSSLGTTLCCRSIEQLKSVPSVCVVHDCSEIRKPYSEQLELLGKVRSLEGSTINGYRTFNSVAIGKDTLHLLDCVPFSPVSQDFAASDAVQLGQNSNKTVAFEQISAISKAFKLANPEQIVWHLIDREADDAAYFGFIEGLGDKFVIRLKLNRNADVQFWDEEKNKEKWLKIRDKTLHNAFSRHFEKFVWKGRVHQNVKAEFSYEHMYLTGQWVWVVKIKVLDRNGKPIFKEPMILTTNHPLTNDDLALFIYQKYLKRAKIEGVFKFLKEHLGWEDFQVRNFQAIQNLILLVFFIGAYFFECQKDIVKDYLTQTICTIGGGKGKFTKHFFLEGILKIAHFIEVQDFIEQNDISEHELRAFFNRQKNP